MLALNFLGSDTPRSMPSKLVTIHRCIEIPGPAIRVSYRDPSIAILKKKKKI